MLKQGEVWDCIIGCFAFLLAIPNFIQAYTDFEKPKRNKSGQLHKLIHNALWITGILIALGSFLMANYEEHPRLTAVSYSMNEMTAGCFTFALTQICLNALRSFYQYCHNMAGDLPKGAIIGIWSLNVLCVCLWIMAMFAMTLGSKPTSWKSGSYFANACVLLALSGLLVASKWNLREAEAQIKAALKRESVHERPIPWYKKKPDIIWLLTFFTLGLSGWIGFQTWRIWTHKELYWEYDTKKYAIITAVMARAIGLFILAVTTYVMWEPAQVDVVFPKLSRFARQTLSYVNWPSRTTYSSTSSVSEKRPTPSVTLRHAKFNQEKEEKMADPMAATPSHADETRVSVELQTPAGNNQSTFNLDPSPDKSDNTEKQPMLTTSTPERPTIAIAEDELVDDRSRDSITAREKLLFTTSVSSVSMITSPTSQDSGPSSRELTPTSQRARAQTPGTPRSGGSSSIS